MTRKVSLPLEDPLSRKLAERLRRDPQLIGKPCEVATTSCSLSATHPCTVPVLSQSPSLKSCSKNSSSPEMIVPTAFWSAKPKTMEVTPRAASRGSGGASASSSNPAVNA